MLEQRGNMRSYLWSLGFLWAACGPIEPPTYSSFVVEVGADALPQNPSINTAFLSIGRFELISDVNTEGLSVSEDKAISLLEGGDIEISNAPPALYSRLRLKLDKLKENLPEEFNGEKLAILFTGEAQIADNQTVPFRYQSKKTSGFINLPFPQSVDLLPGADAKLSLSQNLEGLLEGLPLADVQSTDLTDGVLLIDDADPSFLNQHPVLKEIAQEIEDRLPTTFVLSLE